METKNVQAIPVNVAKAMERVNGNNSFCKVEPHKRLIKQTVMPLNTHAHSNMPT